LFSLLITQKLLALCFLFGKESVGISTMKPCTFRYFMGLHPLVRVYFTDWRWCKPLREAVLAYFRYQYSIIVEVTQHKLKEKSVPGRKSNQVPLGSNAVGPTNTNV